MRILKEVNHHLLRIFILQLNGAQILCQIIESESRYSRI